MVKLSATPADGVRSAAPADACRDEFCHLPGLPIRSPCTLSNKWNSSTSCSGRQQLRKARHVHDSPGSRRLPGLVGGVTGRLPLAAARLPWLTDHNNPRPVAGRGTSSMIDLTDAIVVVPTGTEPA